MKKTWCTVGVTLTLLVFTLLGLLAHSITGLHQHFVASSTMHVFLAADHQLEGLQQAVEGMDGIRDVSWMSQDEAWQQYTEVVDLLWLEDNPLPDMLEVTVDPSRADQVYQKLSALEGVEHTAFYAEGFEVLARLERVTSVAARLLWFLSAFGCTLMMAWILQTFPLSLRQYARVVLQANFLVGAAVVGVYWWAWLDVSLTRALLVMAGGFVAMGGTGWWRMRVQEGEPWSV